MCKPSQLSQAILVALCAPLMVTAANADVEVSGYIKNETTINTKDGQYNGEANSVGDTETHHDRVQRSETSARLFLNGELGEDSSWHADLNMIYDAKGIDNDWKGYQRNSQHDWLREAYVDAKVGNTDVRIGKQQVVWGTADGIKLLDIINPTDYREFSQNTMEDSRIPVWMLNADTQIGDNSSLQFILSENQKSVIAGLNEDGDSGHPFVMKGVDTITGQSNGFLNIAPALGSTAANFVAFTDNPATATVFDPVGLTAGGGGFATVEAFAAGQTPFCQSGSPDALIPGDPSPTNPFAGYTCGQMLSAIAEVGIGLPGIKPNNGKTNLVNPTYDSSNPDSAFEYMSEASFATFDTFAGISSSYRKDKPAGANFGTRWKSSTDSGFNYSLNYLYSFDQNPSISIGWEDPNGNKLTPVYNDVTGTQFAAGSSTGVGITGVDAATGQPTVGQGGLQITTVSLQNEDGTAYNGSPFGATAPANLVFTETQHRMHNLGASFDTSVDTKGLGAVVLRGEFLYQKDVRVPVVDRSKLGVGDLVGALRAEKADFFKYVLGVDVTVAKNMLISTQFIQFINLDYIDDRTDTVLGGSCDQSVNSVNCGVYTADPATLSMSNGFNKGEKTKEFISLFFSKPFGSEQQGRWNNITIFEDTGGRWNRFDVEYGFTDNVIGTFEWNHYFGDENSTFGQMKNASNIMLGAKYLFD